MRLIKHDDPILTHPALPVTEFTTGLPDLIADMYETLATTGGIALAAPQVGIALRVVVYSIPATAHAKGMRGYLINPVITGMSANPRPVTEGCLSFPGRYWKVMRAMRVSTRSVDHFGRTRDKEWRMKAAQMVQHELDHLDGILLPTVAIREVFPPAR